MVASLHYEEEFLRCENTCGSSPSYSQLFERPTPTRKRRTPTQATISPTLSVFPLRHARQSALLMGALPYLSPWPPVQRRQPPPRPSISTYQRRIHPAGRTWTHKHSYCTS